MGIPGFPFLRDFRDPVVVIGAPFSTQTADDTGAYVLLTAIMHVTNSDYT